MIAKSSVRTQNVICGLPSRSKGFTKLTAGLYDLFYQPNFDKTPEVPAGFEDLVDTLYTFHKETYDTFDVQQYCTQLVHTIEENKRVLVAFSGGVDSCYLALWLRDQGYDVSLFHITNFAPYTNGVEDTYARNFAEKGKFDYVEASYKEISKRGFNENPLKNQLIISMLLDYACDNQIYNLALGIDWDYKLEESVLGVDETDTYEVNTTFFKGIEQYVKFNLIIADEKVKKYERLKYINDAGLLDDVYSCVMTYRYHDALRKQNEDKYNIKLLSGRCGSCNKCAREAILLRYLGIMYTDNESDSFIDHCWKVLHENKYSANSDRYDPKIPYAQRLAELLDEGS